MDSFRQVLYVDIVTGTALRNSVLLATVGATIAVLAAAMLALFFRRWGGRLSRVVDGLIRLPATISSIIVAVGFILAFTGAPFYLQGTVLILLLAYITLLMPQAAVIADAAASQIGSELDEASRISGAGAGRTFRFALVLTAIATVVVTVVLAWSRRRGGPSGSDLVRT